MLKNNKLDTLIALYIFCVIVSELMGAKTFPLLHLGTLNINASMAIFVLPAIFAINDIITEIYGKQRARGIIKLSLFIIGLLFLFSILATSLPPSARFASSELAFDEIFRKSIRISGASLLSFALADFLDVAIFSNMRAKWGKKRLWLRTNVSNFISQLIDTSTFMLLAFYSFSLPGKDNLVFLLSLIIPYWLLKCSMSIIETPFVYLGVKWLKGKEQV